MGCTDDGERARRCRALENQTAVRSTRSRSRPRARGDSRSFRDVRRWIRFRSVESTASLRHRSVPPRPYVRLNNIEPRFLPVSPDTLFDDALGYGWARGGRWREAAGLALTPYQEVRGVAKEPRNLPRDQLFRDYIRGEGDQVFSVKVATGLLLNVCVFASEQDRPERDNRSPRRDAAYSLSTRRLGR